MITHAVEVEQLVGWNKSLMDKTKEMKTDVDF